MGLFSACDILQRLNNLDYWSIFYLKVLDKGCPASLQSLTSGVAFLSSEARLLILYFHMRLSNPLASFLPGMEMREGAVWSGEKDPGWPPCRQALTVEITDFIPLADYCVHTVRHPCRDGEEVVSPGFLWILNAGWI